MQFIRNNSSRAQVNDLNCTQRLKVWLENEKKKKPHYTSGMSLGEMQKEQKQQSKRYSIQKQMEDESRNDICTQCGVRSFDMRSAWKKKPNAVAHDEQIIPSTKQATQ
jgi:hypothetical protein